MKAIWKFILVIFLFLALLGYAGFYLYNYNKKNGLANTNSENQIPPPINVNQEEKNQIPIYLTEDFWKVVTPQELENQLKTIADVNEVRLDNKQSMLHLLVKHGNYPEMVKMLIDAGVDYKLKDEVTSGSGEIDNRKALFYAIIREDQAYEFSQTLLEYSDPNSYINNKATPLILAAYYRETKIVQDLLKKGANPNIKSSTQSTPLIATSAKNVFTNNSYIDPNTIQLLLDHNADITAKNKKGKNAFDYMKENEEFTKTELFKKLSEQFPQ